MLDVRLKVTLVLQGPVMSRSSVPRDPGVDSPMARDDDGNCCLPFSLVRGRLRQSWEELADATNDDTYKTRIVEMLGAESGDASREEAQAFQPVRGRLSFTDFTAVRDQQRSAGRSYRVPQDPERKSTRKGGLLVLEVPYAPGEPVQFAGTIGFAAADKAEAERIAAVVTRGLRWTTSLGAERTIGFGQLIRVEVAAEETEVAVVPAIAASGTQPLDYLSIAIKPEAPFCVARPQPNRNLFVSDDVLSGGVLRGAIATTVKRLLCLPHDRVIDENLQEPFRELGRHFGELRFLHAFPAHEKAGKRPVFPPLSLVSYQGLGIRDMALLKGPLVLGTPPSAPSFRIDWKGKTKDEVLTEFGWSSPRRELRVRTKINSATRRAEDEKLFAYEMVVPNGHEWLSTIDLTRITDLPARQKVMAELRAIFKHGLLSIGKTKARAQVTEIGAMSPTCPSKTQDIDGHWVITLQTPAILCDPRKLDESSGGEDLHKAYAEVWRDISGNTAEVWRDISGNTLELAWFFAGQTLAGGYLVRRYQPPDKPYNPFLLTDAGSVFVLRAVGDLNEAQKVIIKWLDNGLPLPAWAKEEYGTKWSECPFLPEDGFGEVAVNLPCHTEKRPSPEEVEHGIL